MMVTILPTPSEDAETNQIEMPEIPQCNHTPFTFEKSYYDVNDESYTSYQARLIQYNMLIYNLEGMQTIRINLMPKMYLDLCVLLGTGCIDESCEHFYIASEGNGRIDDLGASSQQFIGELSQMSLLK